LTRNPKRKRPLAKPMLRGENNIKMDFKEVELGLGWALGSSASG